MFAETIPGDGVMNAKSFCWNENNSGVDVL